LNDSTLPLHVTPRLAAWLLCVERSVIREKLTEGRLEAAWCEGCHLSRSAHWAIPLSAVLLCLERREARVSRKGNPTSVGGNGKLSQLNSLKRIDNVYTPD
jgi:hypothetical protein